MRERLADAIVAVAGAGGETVALPGQPEAAPGPESRAFDLADLPDEGIRLLDLAEERLREGDWAGFGRALDELRRLLGGAGSER
jgi:hypothetical protein